MLLKPRFVVAVCGLCVSVQSLAQTGISQAEPIAGPTNIDLADTERAYAAELTRDASTRTSFLADGGGAGFSNGKFGIWDADKNNTLNIGGSAQFRYSADFRDDDVNDQDGDGEADEDVNEDFTSGFSVRRARMKLSGSVWNKALTYAIQLDTTRSTGDVTLLEAYGQYAWSNGVIARWGQYKLPFLREQIVSATHELTTDFSPSHDVFSLNYSQAVGVGYAGETFRIVADVSDGSRNLNTDFNSNAEADFAITSRAEWMWAGDNFKRFDDFTSFRSQDFTGMLGVAAHYQMGGETGGLDATGAPDGTNSRDLFAATVDASFEGSGWNAFVAGYYRNDDNDEVAESDDFSDFGILVQGGYFFTDQVEGFARYDVVLMDGDRSVAPDGDDSFHSVAGGFNYYISPESHALKFSAQVNYFFNPTTDVEIVSTSTSIPLLRDGEEGQVSAILQMQIMF